MNLVHRLEPRIPTPLGWGVSIDTVIMADLQQEKRSWVLISVVTSI